MSNPDPLRQELIIRREQEIMKVSTGFGEGSVVLGVIICAAPIVRLVSMSLSFVRVECECDSNSWCTETNGSHRYC